MVILWILNLANLESMVGMMKAHDLPLITYKEHFFRKGDKVRVMWNKELKELGYDIYFNENGDLMDGTNKNIVMIADEIEYVGTCFEIINEVGYSYDALLKFGDYVTYCDVRYLCLWDGE